MVHIRTKNNPTESPTMILEPFPKILAITLMSAALGAIAVQADVKPNPLFTNGAVLQRGQVVPVWGTAEDGEKVTVELGKQKVSTTAKDGKWRVDLQPLEVGDALTMTISGKNTVEVKNLLVGEVWVCSGQSNMEYKFNGAATANEDKPKANYPKLRMFTVKRTTASSPQTESVGSWIECTPETVGGFSAVGYYFAQDLHEKLGVPIGMIHTSWGGTPAQAWTSIEGFEGHEELQGFTKNAQDLLAKPPEKGPGPNQATSLYNGMIAPILPYGMKGVIWYQGESNAKQSKQYQTLFPAMIADWRNKWKQGNFPFFFVQIAPFKGQPPEIREAQFLTLAKSENTAMAVTTDVGNANDIHPKQKKPVGHRLALAARALVYGEKIEHSGPLYDSMKASADAIELSFKHVGGGLVAKDGDLKGFTIAGEDGKFVPAKAVIKGDKIVVSADEVKSPKAARYGWVNVPDVNLYNKEDLPASPFRTDVE
jgi:sialate O-acetylesterase